MTHCTFISCSVSESFTYFVSSVESSTVVCEGMWSSDSCPSDVPVYCSRTDLSSWGRETWTLSISVFVLHLRHGELKVHWALHSEAVWHSLRVFTLHNGLVLLIARCTIVQDPSQSLVSWSYVSHCVWTCTYTCEWCECEFVYAGRDDFRVTEKVIEMREKNKNFLRLFFKAVRAFVLYEG